MTSSAVDRMVHCPTPEDRAAVEALVADLPGRARPGDKGFEAPWELRAFALAVTAHKAGQFEWPQFQAALIASIKDWEETHPLDDASWSYYEHWVNAFENVLDQVGLRSWPRRPTRTTTNPTPTLWQSTLPCGREYKETNMNNTPTAAAPRAGTAVPAWVWAMAAIALFAVYFLLQENGTLLSAHAAQYLHEITHDGRHALGVPCH